AQGSLPAERRDSGRARGYTAGPADVSPAWLATAPAWQTGAAWAGESRVAHPGRLYARDMSAVGGPRGAWPTYACPCESAGYPLRGTGGQPAAPHLRSRRNTSAPGTALA